MSYMFCEDLTELEMKAILQSGMDEQHKEDHASDFSGPEISEYPRNGF